MPIHDWTELVFFAVGDLLTYDAIFSTGPVLFTFK